MTIADQNKRSASTTWGWKKVKIQPPLSGPRKTAPKASSKGLSQWNDRDPLSVQVTYRGGAECWWELRARGKVWRRPGHLCLEDVMRDIVNGVGGKDPEPRRK